MWQARAEQLITGRIDIVDLTVHLALVERHRDALGAIWTWAGPARSVHGR